jgi:hypothetical protein
MWGITWRRTIRWYPANVTGASWSCLAGSQ